ncbi:guanine nucleotide exchange factor VAV2-like isoform X1 [Crassostrea angulata]|uniref:guanine nucleotide exchange factor VAV2-like isoform X1 n=1 Tax=Magallana angulata TaxID=2784310 RepID=UPI0022B1A592|nr:guanine nucleotide exchange factor VAV2-like isoform X1 [Crassostrea angulata]XP_052720653.1 guanine nucleotide exchange factor VAV2-like isoform X1 [Crassostrea angulata]
MAMEEWRHCVDWLVRCNILPEEHRATQPDASAFDLAQTLRDGVLICHLLNTLSPNSVDLKDFSQRPQLSQFLCLKNIRTFLQSCQSVFGLSTSDLFDPLDLFEVRDFRKVLTTLSKLSKTPIAKRRHSGFPPEQFSHRPPPPRRYQDDDDDIYGNLPDLALHHDLDDNEEIYDHVYQEDDDEIYEDLCTRNRRESSISELPAPVTKRDYCIKELHDTEKNYVDALRMIHLKFNKPLKDIISKADRDVIFAHIEKLLDVHEKFQAELQSACTSGKPKIGEVFVKYKKSLLLYGNYCSDMPKAQERLEEVTRRNENIRTQIENCERLANDGKFKLRDLLHVPMQRVLKYHLLLRELIKQSGKQAEDKDSLEQGLEAMMDLSLYVNEVKRDNETLQLIEEIQSSIGDLQMPANTTLKDYGRLQKDGELKVKNHTDNKIRIRYIFLFDKVMLMCKAKMVDRLFSGESYSFKEAIILAVYKVQDQQPANRETQRRGDKWNSSFVMGKKDGSNAFSFFAKTEDMKAKWIDAIKLALENASPPQGINYVMHTFDQPTECSVCGKLLRGVFFQGYKCTDPGSDIAVHKECIGKKPNTGSRVPPIPARVMETSHTSTYMEVIHEHHRSVCGAKSSFECSRTDIIFQTRRSPTHVQHRQVRALCNYTGNPNPGGGRPALRFQKDDVIKLLNNDAQWWKGLLNGDEGWFPSQLVQEIENKIRRKPSYLDVKIRSRTENGTPSNISPPRAHSPANNKPYVNVVDDDRSSDQLSVYKWFVGPMGRDTANHRMEHMPNGTFLIRVSENPGRKGELSLSIRYDNQVRHIRVEKNAEGLFYLADTKFFSSLPELVEFYQENSLADSFPGVDTTLKFPFKTQSGGGANTRILGYAEAVYDYAATATSQLSLCRGDKVAILSKTGSDKGWWKGEHCISGKNGYFPLAYVRELDDD